MPEPADSMLKEKVQKLERLLRVRFNRLSIECSFQTAVLYGLKHPLYDVNFMFFTGERGTNRSTRD